MSTGESKSASFSPFDDGNDDLANLVTMEFMTGLAGHETAQLVTSSQKRQYNRPYINQVSLAHIRNDRLLQRSDRIATLGVLASIRSFH